MLRTFDTPIHTNDQSIDRVLAAGRSLALIFLDGPAPAALETAMEEAAHGNAGSLLVVTVQVKDSPASAQRFGISRTPALATYRDGNVLVKVEGITPAALDEHIPYLLGKGPKPQAEHQLQTGYRSQASGPTGERAVQAPRSGYAQQPASPLTVTDATFAQEVMRSPLPVVVDFWAPWCGPCRMVAPALDKISFEMSGRLAVAKVNVDENPIISQQYSVQSIPTMLIVKNGKIIDRWAGALPEPTMRARINQALG